MNLYDVIKKPVITEKSMAQLEAGKYVFEVDTRAVSYTHLTLPTILLV